MFRLHLWAEIVKGGIVMACLGLAAHIYKSRKLIPGFSRAYMKMTEAHGHVDMIMGTTGIVKKLT